VMERDARRMRGSGPFLFTQVTHGIGIPEIVRHILAARNAVLASPA
jgi:urease accessory protein